MAKLTPFDTTRLGAESSRIAEELRPRFLWANTPPELAARWVRDVLTSEDKRRGYDVQFAQSVIELVRRPKAMGVGDAG